MLISGDGPRFDSKTGTHNGSERENMALAKIESTDELGAIVARLEEDIALGRILPRERLIEDELSLRFGANRHVIRQVLMDLETMGLVARQKNKGATVRDLTPEDVTHIYAVRELLEGKAAELIPLPASPDFVAALKDILKRHKAASDGGDLAGVFRLNLDFHKTFFDACGNPRLVEAIQQFAQQAHLVRSLTVGDPKLLKRAIEEHAQIVSHLQNGDRAALVRDVVGHIRPARDAYLETYRRRFGK